MILGIARCAVFVPLSLVWTIGTQVRFWFLYLISSNLILVTRAGLINLSVYTEKLGRDHFP